MSTLFPSASALRFTLGLIAATPFVAHTQVPSAQAPAPSDSAAEKPAVIKHRVKRGDTLWDLANFYLKDPFRWPEVFQANTDIVKNPHWIYPDQILTIVGSAVKDEVAARADSDGFVVDLQTQPAPSGNAPSGNATAFLSHRAPPPPAQAVLTKPPVYTVRRGEYEAAPFVVDPAKPLGGGIINAPVDRMARGLHSEGGFQLHDRLFVTPPAGVKVQPGDYLLLATANTIVPELGRIVEPVGVLKVDSVTQQGYVRGAVVRQFGTISRQAAILPFDRSFQESTTRPTPGMYPVAGNIAWIQKSPLLGSLQTYVVVDVKGDQGLKPGDQFTLFDDRLPPGQQTASIPAVPTATVQVVRVTRFGATGLIVNHQQPVVNPGMTARLTARMP